MKPSALFSTNILAGFAAAILSLLTVSAAQAQTACNAPAADVVSVTTLPGQPFSALPAADGCTLFVSMDTGGKGHIGVFSRSGGKLSLSHDIATPARGLAGMALSHDGKVLAAASGDGVMLFDTAKLMAGDGTPLAQAVDRAQPPRPQSGAVYVAITPDDRLLFVSDESAAALTVYDLARLKGGDVKAIGRIPVGNAPVGLVFSPDGKRLYNTSEVAEDNTASRLCTPPAGGGPNLPEGVLTVIDVDKAASNPARAVLARMTSGCDPVRVVLSADGTRAYVTTRSANALRVYDTTRMIADVRHALLATIAVGKAPVGVALAGDRIVTSDSNRFGPNGRKSEWLSVIDATRNQVIGSIPAGLFPREMVVTADGKTLVVTNAASASLQLVDLDRLTPAYFAGQKPIRAAADAEQARADAALQARITAKQASPGTEAALRKFIASMQAKAPIYDELAPTLAANVRASAEQMEARLAGWGAVQSVIFLTATPQNMDVFEVDFEHQKTRWQIAIGPDGKIGPLGFGPMP